MTKFSNTGCRKIVTWSLNVKSNGCIFSETVFSFNNQHRVLCAFLRNTYNTNARLGRKVFVWIQSSFNKINIYIHNQTFITKYHSQVTEKNNPSTKIQMLYATSTFMFKYSTQRPHLRSNIPRTIHNGLIRNFSLF